MKYILPALPILLGFFLDLLVGDPRNFPHPIRAVGKTISALEKAVRSRFIDLRKGGTFLALTVITVWTVLPLAVLTVSYRLHTALGVAVETVLCCYMLAARDLRDESMEVCKAAENGDISWARRAVSMIVGRDTAVLDLDGIVRAAVETVAENTSDGVTAPLFYMGFGGAAAGFFYKSVNTMDSMIGYKNEKFADIGRFAAKLDDVLNFIPSRLTALLTVAASSLVGCDGKNSYKIWKRDRRNHASPNSAQTEAAFAGALHLRLAGDAWYFGELHKKPYIGDNDRKIEPRDIRRANRLMYAASALMLAIACAIRILIYGVIFG
ncbi:MAG: cobalamin biosynthesis protein CobD [Ruminococcus sp.]|nr:cobalamin biosynthesis protein CobD [Ruminococcus sp.]